VTHRIHDSAILPANRWLHLTASCWWHSARYSLGLLVVGMGGYAVAIWILSLALTFSVSVDPHHDAGGVVGCHFLSLLVVTFV